jgi:hypothetical protein
MVLLKLLDRYRFGNPASRYDRALVLISGAFIEQGLEAVITQATVREYDDRALHSELFGGDRPGAINGFYGKIILGHALGAYTRAFKEDLDRIRHIRNAFAHAKGEISFKTKEVGDVCEFNITDHFSSLENPMLFTGARSRYVFLVFFVVLTFQLTVKDLSSDSRPASFPNEQVLP